MVITKQLFMKYPYKIEQIKYWLDKIVEKILNKANFVSLFEVFK